MNARPRTVRMRMATSAADQLARPFRETPDRSAADALERKIRLLMEAEKVGGVGGWELDPETGMVAWTPEMRRIMGMPPDTEQLPLEQTYGFFTSASRSIVREAFNATRTRGIPYDLVLECITASGARIWVREVCRAVMQRGRLLSVIGFTQDITEQRRLAGLLDDIAHQERASARICTTDSARN